MFEIQTEGWHPAHFYISNISLFLAFPDREKPNKTKFIHATQEPANTVQIL